MPKLYNNFSSVFLKDIKPAGTAGGTFSGGAWQTRVLNTIENAMSYSWISLASNQFTLQPGTYEIEASAPAQGVNQHQAKIRNITDGTDAIIGTSEYTTNANTGYVPTRSLVHGSITITSAKVFELQHRANSSYSANGFGEPSGMVTGLSEVYSIIKIRKLA